MRLGQHLCAILYASKTPFRRGHTYTGPYVQMPSSCLTAVLLAAVPCCNMLHMYAYRARIGTAEESPWPQGVVVLPRKIEKGRRGWFFTTATTYYKCDSLSALICPAPFGHPACRPAPMTSALSLLLVVSYTLVVGT